VAQVQGIPIQFYRYAFIPFSLAVAVAIKAVGVLLVNAFCTPASTAKPLSQHFTRLANRDGCHKRIAGMIGLVFSTLLLVPASSSSSLCYF